MKNFMMNFIPVIVVEIIAVVTCFILAGHSRSQELYTLGEFLLLVLILTFAMGLEHTNKNKDD